MKRTKSGFKFAAVAALLASFNPAEATAAKYTIDMSHTTIGFSVRHMVISNVKGQFNRFGGEFEFDAEAIEIKSASIAIDTSSIDTNESKRDEHLRSEDFFDVKKFPEMKFAMTSQDRGGDGSIKVTGDLTIRGITKPVTLTGEFIGAVKDPWGKNRVGFSARGEINRKDYGLAWNKLLETGGAVVGDMVTLTIEVEGVEAK